MGKKGDALRAAKRAKVIAPGITRGMREDALLAQRRANAEIIKKQCMADMQREKDAVWKQVEEREKTIWKHVEDEWDIRKKEFMSGDRMDDFFTLLKYVSALNVEILCEQFGWKAPPNSGTNDRRYKINRYLDAFTEKVNTIGTDEMIDIRRYVDGISKKYNLHFEMEVEE